MNILYKLTNLLDGEFDGQTIHYRRVRAYWNLFVEYATYSFLIPHCVVFFNPDLAPYVGKFECLVRPSWPSQGKSAWLTQAQPTQSISG